MYVTAERRSREAISLPKRESSIWWKCRESNPSPNPSMKENLRRVVSVIFKAGCEERRRNHSYPIPYLNASGGKPNIGLTDDSAHLLRCERREKTDVAQGEERGVSREPSRRRTQSHAYRSTETSRLQEYFLQVFFSLDLSDRRDALRRTSFKVQTVKAGHSQKIHDTIVYFLRVACKHKDRNGSLCVNDFSKHAQSLSSHRVFLSPLCGLFFLYRERPQCAP